MLKGRGRDPRGAVPPTPTMSIRSTHRPMTKPEPDYEVVEFPSEQYVNAKLQPPPPPPPRPPTGHPTEAGASCGLCGGGGARVRCAECGRRALCASCDDMYHRHPKRRNHQRQALSLSQLRDERPPLPPKTGPPVPPPRKHKVSGDRLSASPRPPADQRRATLNPMSPQISGMHAPAAVSNPKHFTQRAQQAIPPHLQVNMPTHTAALGTMPYLSATMHHTQTPVVPTQEQSNTLGHVPNAWGRQRASLPGFVPPNMQPMMQGEAWETQDNAHMATQSWGRPLRRGTSVMELGVGPPPNPCAGCAHCMGQPWRYGSCASLDHTWVGPWPPSCYVGPHPQQNPRLMHPHAHPPQTPQPYRRAESRAMSRTASRAGSRAASPAMSVRSRTSRRPKHRTPSPPALPSSDADSESEESDHRAPKAHSPAKDQRRAREHSPARDHRRAKEHSPAKDHRRAKEQSPDKDEDNLGPPPPPPSATWQCEHCTFVNEPGVRVCVVCCRTPTITPMIINTNAIKNGISHMKISDRAPSVARSTIDEPIVKHAEDKSKAKKLKERTSTACGPSPPREERVVRKPLSRLATPAREEFSQPTESHKVKHDMAVGPSPPKEMQNHNVTRTSTTIIRQSPYRNNASEVEEPKRHNVSVGPSPPRDLIKVSHKQADLGNQKKSTGTSPPREIRIDTPSSLRSTTSSRANVSNTGTSPPPQSISTQTYDVPVTREWERAPSVSRSRARRRFRDDARRERSHSRHSLSSDTRESERSVRTSGGATLGPGRWEWREPRDSSPGAEWSGSERRRSDRLTRRASHMDLRRTRPSRRSSVYGSEAPSPEPFSGNRAVSLEALAGAGARRETERGLELARLMGEAEKLGFSAAEVHAALAQNPAAPLAWLRERWPSLVAGVRAAAVRLAPGAVINEREARTALARHRGAMWPAVTDCVEKWRRQTETLGIESEGRLRGHVWGSPTGVEDDAVPPINRSHRIRAEESSDELEMMAPAIFPDDDWMYMPPENNINDEYEDYSTIPQTADENRDTEDIAQKLKLLLIQAGIPNINEQLLLKGLLANQTNVTEKETNLKNSNNSNIKLNPSDFLQSENDFIDAYNALTRLSPLPNLSNSNYLVEPQGQSNNNEEHVQQPNNENNHAKSDNMKTEPQSHLNSSQSSGLKSPKTQKKHLQVKHNNSKTQVSPVHIKSLKDVTDTKKHQNLEAITQSLSRPDDLINQDIKNQPFINPEKVQILENKLDISESREINEKPNNLTDMVDNTQKLIQQMKKELHSDIRSLDSRSNTDSDADNSSNESDLSSDKETSYSDTENETEEMSSDENESKTSHSTNSHNPRNSVVNKTSSDENEQFEEAIDHIEENLNTQFLPSNNHTQGFKQTNIEILDNIAKTLQEDHLISFHNNSRNLPQAEPQDFNNNLFDAVNSFEEIYDQLTERTDTRIKSIVEESNMKQKNNKNEYDATNKPTGIKHDIEFVDYNIKPANFLLRYENVPPLRHAFIEDNHEEMDIIDIPENSSSSIEPSSLEANEDVHSIEIIEADSEESIGSQNVIKSSPPPEVNQNILPEPLNSIPEKVKNEISNEINIQENKSVIQYSEHINVVNNEIKTHVQENDSVIQNSEHINVGNNEIQTQVQESESVIQNSEHINVGNNEIQTKVQESESVIQNSEHINVGNNEIQTQVQESESIIQNLEHINVGNNGIKTPDSEINIKSNESIVNQSAVFMELTTNGNSSSPNNKGIFNKSNIPKLVKAIQNNKVKVEKNNSKILGSKVPIRRTSIKQYPAPAPPKTHFGNVQNGHVKQLQTRLFNSKLQIPTNLTGEVEIKPSTSATNTIKKKPAPLPPTQTEQKNLSPPKDATSVEKNQFFRETCRTEDEWTDSDAEDKETINEKKNSEIEEPARFSPPPPITMRRISGQLIDLATIRIPEGSPERQARMLLAEGATENWEQAQLAIELISRGIHSSAALLAALECTDLDSALAYLHQDCELCASRLPEYEMVSMLRCTHRCCRECARHYFTVQITERSIADCVCPYCKEPELENLPEDAWLEYFAHLDILLKTLLDVRVHELFQRKLRDRTLARDPNFKWCVECSSGFFVHPKQKKLRCPECKSVSCAACRKPWSSNHEGLSCEQYVEWLEDNDPERSIAAVQQHLRENGLECPRCHFKYSLSRGGCMHFTCTQCKYEFCYGCGKPFMMGAQCGLSEYCAKLGLHAHHPRNCLFYLRDKEPHELQTLLQMNNVTYETEPSEGSTGRCPIQLQRETPTGLVDGPCGSESSPNNAGLCKNHYLEYLSRLVRTKGMDPLPILAVDDLETLVRRAALHLPPRPYGTLEGLYKRALVEIVRAKIPLD